MIMKDTVNWYENKEGRNLPAIRILECVFVLEEPERILHFHSEELDIKIIDSEARYFENDKPPFEERSRCQVIPPFVNAFRDIKRRRAG